MAVKMVKGTSLVQVRTGFVDDIDGVGPLNPRQFKPAKIEVGHAGTLHGPYHSNIGMWDYFMARWLQLLYVKSNYTTTNCHLSTDCHLSYVLNTTDPKSQTYMT